MSKLIFSDSIHSSKILSKLFLQGKLRRIYHGIYTDDLTESLIQIVQKEWINIIHLIVPKGILSFRSAYDLKPIPFERGMHIVYVTSSYHKTIELPGLIIKVVKGNYQD